MLLIIVLDSDNFLGLSLGIRSGLHREIKTRSGIILFCCYYLTIWMIMMHIIKYGALYDYDAYN